MSEYIARHIGIGELTSSNRDLLAQGMSREKSSILPVTANDIVESFNAGLSTVLLEQETGKAVGHIRFSPLITPMLKDQLSLPPTMPLLMEIGTGYIAKEHRGNGLYTLLRNEHIGRFKDELASGSHVFLGTTKTLRVLHALRHAQERYGIEGVILPHTQLPFIAAFTCVCKGDFGNGYQCGVDACGNRIKQEQFPMGKSINGLLDQMDVKSIDEIKDLNGGEGTIPCTMYIQGNKGTIIKMEEELKKQFGTPENLVAQLRQPNVDYYEEMTTN